MLLVLAIIIFGYIYLTDAQRVRSMASSYLSDLLGGEVTIGKANLSIFEGLRLDDVTLRVDQKQSSRFDHLPRPDVSASLSPAQLLAGRLAATQIVAIDPVVYLVEDPQTHRWNYQRMWHGAGPIGGPRANGVRVRWCSRKLFCATLRSPMKNCTMDKTVPMGWYSIEGSLDPSDEEADRYDFQLQSRGRESMGPSVDGTIRTQGGMSVAHMQNFTFGPDIKTMLRSPSRGNGANGISFRAASMSRRWFTTQIPAAAGRFSVPNWI